LNDDRILRTRISRPANKDSYGPSLWAAILRDQLEVTEANFWQCVDHQVPPPRPADHEPPAAEGLPAGLVHQLKSSLRLSDTEVASLSRGEAVARMAAYWSQPPS